MIAALLAAAAVWILARPVGRPAIGGVRHLGTALPVAAGTAAAVAVAAGSPAAAALMTITAGAAWGGSLWWRQRRLVLACQSARDRVLECCDVLAAELIAGQPVGAALGRAVGEWPALAAVTSTHDYGGDVPDAFRRAAEVPGAEGLAVVAAAWQVSHRTGQGLADTLVRVARTLREARATDRTVRSELASARATARLVAVLPVVAWAIGAGSGGNPVGFLLGTPLGLACLAAGLGLGLAGLVWIERIAAGVGR